MWLSNKSSKMCTVLLRNFYFQLWLMRQFESSCSLLQTALFKVLNVPHHPTDMQIWSAYHLLVHVIFHLTGSEGFSLLHLIVMDHHVTNKEGKAQQFMEVSHCNKRMHLLARMSNSLSIFNRHMKLTWSFWILIVEYCTTQFTKAAHPH